MHNPKLLFISLIWSFTTNVYAATPKNTPLKKGTDECELIASFDELMNRKWPEMLNIDQTGNTPRMNIQETPDSYHIEAELPGVKKEDVSVVLKDDYLVISGEKKSFNEERKNQYRRIERTNGTFYRSIAIPRDIDKNKITGELKDGILKIDMLRTKNTNPEVEKKIFLK